MEKGTVQGTGEFLVAITCYYNEEEVVSFAKQLQMQTMCRHIHLCITYNGGKKYEFLQQNLKALSVSFSLVNPSKNMGYLPGCLYGIPKELLTEDVKIMVANTDITFDTDSFFEICTEGITNDIWAVGPDIKLKRNGRHQNPFYIRRPDNGHIFMLKLINTHYILYSVNEVLSPVRKKLFMKGKDCKRKLRSGNVYALHGSCFIITLPLYELLQRYLQDMFMYEEELFIAELVFQNHKNCFFNSRVSVTHNENQTTGTVAKHLRFSWSKSAFKHLYANFFKRNKGRSK